MPDFTLLTAKDFIGVRAALVAELGNDANAALVLTRIAYRTEGGWHECHQDLEGRWWWRATYETLAAETGLTRDQVKRAIRVLLSSEWIEGQTFRLEGAYDRTSSYALPMPDHRANSPYERAGTPDEDRAGTPDVPSIQKVKTLVLFGGFEIPEAEIVGLFSAWYEIYPRHVAKAAALKAWLTAVKKVTPVDLNVATRAFAAKVRREQTDPKFVPHPASWLNAERWLDEDRIDGSGRDAIRSL